ncbi:unnamed protein product [Cuscuta campestris]|uniref:DNA (cytosine-5-)-methyltransferase n=1 Tax=Cuscuta campestris TaxID=132261 RepID=A0A484KZ22_9ASTE|nr:unnamed protein product [Cuscuta campestris]
MLMHNDLVALSFVDYFRPKFLLIENARNLVSFHNMNPFQLIISSLLEMGYQVCRYNHIMYTSLKKRF